MMLSSGFSVLSLATSLRVSRNSKPSVGVGKWGHGMGVMGTRGRGVGTLGRETGWGCGDMEWDGGVGTRGQGMGTQGRDMGI